MTRVSQVLKQKGSEVYVTGPDDVVSDAIKQMAEKDIGSLMVVENGLPVGIFTERHYARNVFLKGKSSPKTRVRDVMSVRPMFAPPKQTVNECMAVMSKHKIRHLPVMDGDKLVGIISIGDLVQSTIADQKFTIEQLEHYICS